MSKLTNALNKYTEASKAVRDFKEKNKSVFEAYESVLLLQKEAEEYLKAVAREEQRNIANDDVKVTYSPVVKVWYDGDFIMSNVAPKLKKQLLEKKAVRYEVDKKKFEDLVSQEVVPIEIQQEAERTQEQTARISIKEV